MDRSIALRRPQIGWLLAALVAALVGVLMTAPADAASPNPLDDDGWVLVAHMSDSGGMFDGNGELLPSYSYGTFDPNPSASTGDFQRVFPVVADEILFITGDLSIWGIADYGTLRALIDARGNAFGPNLAFETNSGGTVGNVLSRNGILEDPWISIVGDHSYGVANDWIVWGENNYSGDHSRLKSNNGGINVFVRSNPPVIAAHADVTVQTSNAAGTTVIYTSPATTDDADPPGTAICLPVSGGLFPIGTTEVTCNATDSDLNPALPTTFDVIVLLDTDSDLAPDATDNCPLVPNPDQGDMDRDRIGDACDSDRDGDGYHNYVDNCPSNKNASQRDRDRDGIGNACDDDRDGDGVLNTADNCPGKRNASQRDRDHDGIGNRCDPDRDGDRILNPVDNCPNRPNALQKDRDGDGIGNRCDRDRDGDGVPNKDDAYPHNPRKW